MGRLGYCVPCGERRRDVDATVVIDGDPLCAFCAREVGCGTMGKLPEAVPLVQESGSAEPDLKPTSQTRDVGHPVLCGRGCGKRPHWGGCAGRPVMESGAAKAEAFRLRTSMSANAIAKRIGWAQPTISRWFREADAEDSAPVRPKPLAEATLLVLEDGVMKPLAQKERGSLMDRLVVEEVGMEEVPMALGQRHPQGRIGELWALFRELKPRRSLKVECRDTVHVGSTDRQMRQKAKKAAMELGSRRVGTLYYCWKIEK